MSKVDKIGTVVVEFDLDELESLQHEFSLTEQQVSASVYNAMNRTISKVISYTYNEVSQEYNIRRRKDIKDIAKIHKPRGKLLNLEASVDYKDARFYASYFPHRISRSINRSPVKLKIKQSYATSGNDPVMFGESKQRRGVGESRQIYKRKRNETNVYPVKTMAIPQMILAPSVAERLEDYVYSEFVTRLYHELAYKAGLK